MSRIDYLKNNRNPNEMNIYYCLRDSFNETPLSFVRTVLRLLG